MMNYVTKWACVGSWVCPIEDKNKKRNTAAEIRTHDKGEARVDEGSTRGGCMGREPVRGSGCLVRFRVTRKMKGKIGACLGFEHVTLRRMRGMIW